MATENQKIPCGGFRIGDGLAMDGDTLKSLGGAYVKVVIDKIPSESSDVIDYSFSKDSPIQSFEELLFMVSTIPITAYVYTGVSLETPLSIANFSSINHQSTNVYVQFDSLKILSPKLLTHFVWTIYEKGVSMLGENYALTPAT